MQPPKVTALRLQISPGTPRLSLSTALPGLHPYGLPKAATDDKLTTILFGADPPRLNSWRMMRSKQDQSLQ